jgi:hypothetical protein
LPEPPGKQLTDNKQNDSAWPARGGKAEPGGRHPGWVTDRDPDFHHEPPICVTGCLLAILFLASQDRVFGVFAHCRAQRSLVLSIRRR